MNSKEMSAKEQYRIAYRLMRLFGADDVPNDGLPCDSDNLRAAHISLTYRYDHFSAWKNWGRMWHWASLMKVAQS